MSPLTVRLRSLAKFTQVSFLVLPPRFPEANGPGGEADQKAVMPKITKRTVDALRSDPSGKDLFVWDAGDGALKGFGLRIKPSGTASYLVQYRNREGRTRRIVLGGAGTLTHDEARKPDGEALMP